MVIIVRNGYAEMFYTTSQWTDAENMMHGGGTGYIVPDTTINDHNILGDGEYEDVTTGEMVPGTDPMTESEVVAIATSSGFPIAN